MLMESILKRNIIVSSSVNVFAVSRSSFNPWGVVSSKIDKSSFISVLFLLKCWVFGGSL